MESNFSANFDAIDSKVRLIPIPSNPNPDYLHKHLTFPIVPHAESTTWSIIYHAWPMLHSVPSTHVRSSSLRAGSIMSG